jgi:hypothetical protein
MSFEAELHAAVLVALTTAPDIADQVNGVFLERPVRATAPYLVLGELLSADWSVKGQAGREARLLVRVHDEGENWARAVTLQGAAGRAIEALPRALGGWSLGSVTLLRSRTLRDGSAGWTGTIEYRVRGMED